MDELGVPAAVGVVEPFLCLRVVRATSLAEGTTWMVRGPTAVIGRVGGDVVLADRTVSREHARIHLGPPVRIEALVGPDQNGTFFDKQSLLPGRPVVVPPEGGHLQLGGVLLAVTLGSETLPVLHPLTSVAVARANAGQLVVQWDGTSYCVAQWGARDLGLTGKNALFLGHLANRVGEFVLSTHLEKVLGTMHLAPIATAARSALATAMEAGAVDPSWVTARLAAAGVDIPRGEGLKGLVHALLRNRRDHGYALQLKPEDVDVRHR